MSTCKARHYPCDPTTLIPQSTSAIIFTTLCHTMMTDSFRQKSDTSILLLRLGSGSIPTDQHLPDLCTVAKGPGAGDCQQAKYKNTKKHREDTISVTRKHDAVDMYLATVENANLSSRKIHLICVCKLLMCIVILSEARSDINCGEVVTHTVINSLLHVSSPSETCKNEKRTFIPVKSSITYVTGKILWPK